MIYRELCNECARCYIYIYIFIFKKRQRAMGYNITILDGLDISTLVCFCIFFISHAGNQYYYIITPSTFSE